MTTRASRLETLYLKLKMDVGTSAVRRGHLLVLHNNAYVILYLKIIIIMNKITYIG
jgi:hypothetical protein